MFARLPIVQRDVKFLVFLSQAATFFANFSVLQPWRRKLQRNVDQDKPEELHYVHQWICLQCFTESRTATSRIVLSSWNYSPYLNHYTETVGIASRRAEENPRSGTNAEHSES
ncbi:hypothetical protein B0H13DRAFT_1914186 [Mycena leptocephala]|nr:hypothetical protein B0H13DRAFT_1914186 [Mycena leptocephala]